MATPKLSIIVPIYNVEQYLRKCVESLLTQDLDPAEYEIILVDDGSTDGSGEIAEQLAGKSEEVRGKSEEVRGKSEEVRGKSVPRITAIHQPNGGLSAARNTGIMAAQGDYVCFVDSDDYWEPNVLGGLMAQVERDDLDVLRFKWQNVRVVSGLADERISGLVDERYEVFNPNKSDPYRLEDYSSDVTTGVDFLNTRFGYACYAVQFIVRRSLLSGQYSEVSGQYSEVSTQKSAITNNQSPILFTSNLHFEDTDWTPRMLLAAQRVASMDTMVYDYLVREGSITKVGANVDKKRRNIEDSMLIVERLGGLLEQHPSCVWLRRMQSSMAAGIVQSVITTFPAERRAYVRRLRQWHVFPLAIANQGRTYVRRARIMNISTWLYAIVMKWMRG